ncbi:MAG TPA: DUF3105 domain-containing protein [Jatrophihabitans sp.]|nr:DUF3105 domain-containing protein [Jatrophihabitans sp.]
MTKPTKPPRATGSKPADRPASGKGRTTAGAADRSKAARAAQSKKIVSQRQTPWGLISVTVIILVLAVAVIGYAVHQGSKKSSSAASSDPNKIAGIVHKTFASGDHKTTVIDYGPDSPPFGGPHSPIWADCTGTVYPNQIASENAVHDLEHGAVWITYKPGLPADQLDVLTKLVSGNQYMLLTPYAGLKSNVSLQAWGYQLFVDSATDPRVTQFITDLKLNRDNTPEYGASCTNADFKSHPSTPGHPTVQ